MSPIPLAGRSALLLLVLALAGCRSSGVGPNSRVMDPAPDLDAAARARVQDSVRAVLDAQVAAWNAGSVRGFMAGYARTDSLTFLSGGSVRRGWQEALYAYVRSYPDAAAMGTLAFSDLTIRPLDRRHALVWGRWRLTRAGDAPGGLFTLLLEETPAGWRVVHDHTSSE